MRVVIVWIGCTLAMVSGCPQSQAPSGSDSSTKEQAVSRPKDWSADVGRVVTVDGWVANQMLGASLQTEQGTIFIDGRDSWQEGFYSGGDRGKHLRVTGTVIKRDDVPVFVQKPGEPPRQGIPVESEAELQTAKWRFLLKEAKWTVLD
jgi:hypothetical protein